MKINRVRGYYFITDSGLSRRGIEEDVKIAAGSGVSVVQYRNKEGSTKELFMEAARLRDLCPDAAFIVNDRIDIALAVGADGIHLGQDDMPAPTARKILGAEAIIGVTVHNEEEALRAEAEGASYLAVSPVFETSTKKDAGSAVGTAMVEKIRKLSALPIVAIGGITLENASSVIEAGSDAVCAISAVAAAEDPRGKIAEFRELFGKCGGAS